MPSPLTISDFKLGWYRSESAVAVLADLNHGLSAKCTDKKGLSYWSKGMGQNKHGLWRK